MGWDCSLNPVTEPGLFANGQLFTEPGTVTNGLVEEAPLEGQAKICSVDRVFHLVDEEIMM
jgi:hypothetical protein